MNYVSYVTFFVLILINSYVSYVIFFGYFIHYLYSTIFAGKKYKKVTYVTYLRAIKWCFLLIDCNLWSLNLNIILKLSKIEPNKPYNTIILTNKVVTFQNFCALSHSTTSPQMEVTLHA
jgi:hypothetical protein